MGNLSIFIVFTVIDLRNQGWEYSRRVHHWQMGFHFLRILHICPKQSSILEKNNPFLSKICKTNLLWTARIK